MPKKKVVGHTPAIPGWDKPGDAAEFGARRAKAATPAQKAGKVPLTSNQRAAIRRARPASATASTSPKGKKKADMRPGAKKRKR